MSQIEIIAYTVVSNNTHRTYRLENKFVDSMDEVEQFKKQQKEFHEKENQSECIIYPVTKHYEEDRTDRKLAKSSRVGG